MGIKERNKKFYTEEGLKSLINRLKSLIRLHNDDEYWEKFLKEGICMLGFKFNIKNREELEIRIIELSEVARVEVNKKIEVTKVGKEKMEKITFEVKDGC